MPNYKRTFVTGYDYFLTVVTHKRLPILIENIDLVRESFKISKQEYCYTIKAVVILPEHFHMIINPKNARDYPNIIKTIKQHFSKHCDPRYYQHIKQSESRTQAGYQPIWQKKYYEHTIRDESDFECRFNYVHFNPVKHGLVKKVKDWPFSSFHRYVAKGIYDQNWGNFDNNIDFE